MGPMWPRKLPLGTGDVLFLLPPLSIFVSPDSLYSLSVLPDLNFECFIYTHEEITY